MAPLAAALLLTAAIGCRTPESETAGPPQPPTAIGVRTSTDTVPALPTTALHEAQTSGHAEPARVVVRDGGAWRAAWLVVNGPIGSPAQAAAAPPAVDFTREMVVVVAAGERPSGGWAIRVDRIVAASDGGATVYVTTVRPDPACMQTMAVTSPVAVVRAPRVGGAVRFEERSEVGRC